MCFIHCYNNLVITEFLLENGQEVAWFTMVCTSSWRFSRLMILLLLSGGDGVLLNTAVAFLETCVLAFFLLPMFNDVLL